MPSGCNCAGKICSCQIIGTGNVSIDGVGTETSPYEIVVEPTRTDYIDTSTVHWTPVTGSGTEASPYQVRADATGAVPAGALGTWGTAPLDDFGAVANSPQGELAYLDNAGKLRTKPLIIDASVALTNADDLSKYPLGPSVYTLSTAQASAGGWPIPNSGTVLTDVRGDGITAVQWYFRNGNTQATMAALWRVFNSTWQPWQRPVFTPDTPADGMVPVYRTASGAYKLEAKTLPPVDTGWITLGTATDLIVPNATNATLVTSNYRQWGPLLQFRIQFTLNVAITTPTTGDVTNTACGTFQPQFRPTQEAAATSYSTSRGLWWAIGVSGNLTLSAVSGSTNLAIGDPVSAAGMFLVG